MSTEQEHGPYIQVAALCENVIEGKDGVLSLIRVIDRFVHTAAGPNPPERLPAFTIAPIFVVMLKAGFVRGSANIRIQPRTPSGRSLQELVLPVLFEADHRGQNLIMKLQLQVEEEGVYWFDVRFGERVLTRVPLQVVYQRLLVTGPSGTPT